jgi:hypothetical protein
MNDNVECALDRRAPPCFVAAFNRCLGFIQETQNPS